MKELCPDCPCKDCKDDCNQCTGVWKCESPVIACQGLKGRPTQKQRLIEWLNA